MSKPQIRQTRSTDKGRTKTALSAIHRQVVQWSERRFDLELVRSATNRRRTLHSKGQCLSRSTSDRVAPHRVRRQLNVSLHVDLGSRNRQTKQKGICFDEKGEITPLYLTAHRQNVSPSRLTPALRKFKRNDPFPRISWKSQSDGTVIQIVRQGSSDSRSGTLLLHAAFNSGCSLSHE